VLENQRNLRSYSAVLGESDDDDREVSTDHTITEQNAKLDLLTRLVTTLSETLTQQQTELKDIKAQNIELREDVRHLQGKIDSYAASLPSTLSWASIAAGQQSTEGGASLSRATSTQSAKEEPNCLRISTNQNTKDGQTTEDSFARYLPTQAANTHIRTALQNSEATKEAQVVGVGTTKTGYVIRFKDANSKEVAKANSEWLETLGNGTKLVKTRYGVVVHRMPTEGLDLPEGKKEAIERIIEENDLKAKGYGIDDIAWLRGKDKPLGVSASLGIWFDTPEAADWTIYNGLVYRQRYIRSMEAYQVKKKRYHRCQGFGHLAWSYKEPMRCGHCSRGHERRDYPPGSSAKYIDYNGPHPTGDKGCRVLAINNSPQ
jgi:hypothetical protein